MLTKRTYFALLVVVALAFPAVALAASGSEGDGGGEAEVAAISQARAVLTPLQRSVEHYRQLADAVGHRVKVEFHAAVKRALHEKYAHLPGGVSIETLESIAACESGGDPRIVSSDGSYRGKYQFDVGTWESVGGHGDPAAAPEMEQDYRAALLYSRSGSSPWPVCG
ncbi:MAG TPA: transglycosylase family protein [Solirubrobacterales bacterium]|nr:transglycosylase family protein [Solirubrobacterales bacterium]